MQIIQPHYHGIARTVQDYERMAMSGVVAVAEPAFWAGFTRAYPETFIDYFRQISEFEPTRAARYGIRHFCLVAVNPKEAENPELSRAVMEKMPEFFERPTVLGVGEIGLHKTTGSEEEIFQAQVEMAIQYDQLILIHTPHLEDKARGTHRILAMLENLSVNPDRVWIDHRRRAHHPGHPGCGLLDRLHALPHHQVLVKAGRGHAGDLRHRTDPGQFLGGLGTERPVHAPGMHPRIS